jgi:hypothetical protein
MTHSSSSCYHPGRRLYEEALAKLNAINEADVIIPLNDDLAEYFKALHEDIHETEKLREGQRKAIWIAQEAIREWVRATVPSDMQGPLTEPNLFHALSLRYDDYVAKASREETNHPPVA